MSCAIRTRPLLPASAAGRKESAAQRSGTAWHSAPGAPRRAACRAARWSEAGGPWARPPCRRTRWATSCVQGGEQRSYPCPELAVQCILPRRQATRHNNIRAKLLGRSAPRRLTRLCGPWPASSTCHQDIPQLPPPQPSNSTTSGPPSPARLALRASPRCPDHNCRQRRGAAPGHAAAAAPARPPARPPAPVGSGMEQRLITTDGR